MKDRLAIEFFNFSTHFRAYWDRQIENDKIKEERKMEKKTGAGRLDSLVLKTSAALSSE